MLSLYQPSWVRGMVQGWDIGPLGIPEQDPESLSMSLEIQTSNPNILKTTILPGLQEAKSMCQMGHLLSRSCIQLQKKKKNCKLTNNAKSYDTVSRSNPAAALGHLGYTLSNMWSKPNLPVTVQSPSSPGKSPGGAFRECIPVHGGRLPYKTHLAPSTCSAAKRA